MSGESVDLYTKTGKRIKSTPVGKRMSSKLPGVQAAALTPLRNHSCGRLSAVNENSLRGPYPLNTSAAVTSYRGAWPTNDPPGMMGNYSSILRDPANANDVWVFGAYGAYSTACKRATEAARITLSDAGRAEDRKH